MESVLFSKRVGMASEGDLKKFKIKFWEKAVIGELKKILEK